MPDQIEVHANEKTVHALSMGLMKLASKHKAGVLEVLEACMQSASLALKMSGPKNRGPLFKALVDKIEFHMNREEQEDRERPSNLH